MKKNIFIIIIVTIFLFVSFLTYNNTRPKQIINDTKQNNKYYQGIKNLQNINNISLTPSEEEHKKYYINNIFPKDLYESYLKLEGNQYVKDNIGNIIYDDGNVVIFAFPSKFGFLLDMYDLKDWKQIEDKVLINKNSFYNNYIVTICSNKEGENIKYNVICYYKIADNKFTRIPQSLLSNGESYLFEGGMGMSSNDVSFEESSKKVKSGVYKESSSLKLREVQFILP